ncbi:MAG: hypothetical protein AAF750_05070 [Planctomycetota bacterium]
MPGMYCKTCLYNLTGTPARPGSGIHECPECGRAFDPLKPRTTLRKPLSRWTRFWLSPPWVLAVVSILLTAGSFVALTGWGPGASDSARGFVLLSFLSWFFVGLPLTVAWLIRVIVLIALRRKTEHRQHHRFGVFGGLAWATPLLAWLSFWGTFWF